MIRPLVPLDRAELRRLLPWLLLGVAVYALASIPYLVAYLRTPPGMVFGGTLIWQSDQNAYFSFIRQSADGHFLFLNRMTSLEHRPAFFNLEWLIVGRLMSWFGETWAYHLWRATGAVAVTGGFLALARLVLDGPALRRIAIVLGLLGGSFHTLYYGLNAVTRVIEKATG